MVEIIPKKLIKNMTLLMLKKILQKLMMNTKILHLKYGQQWFKGIMN